MYLDIIRILVYAFILVGPFYAWKKYNDLFFRKLFFLGIASVMIFLWGELIDKYLLPSNLDHFAMNSAIILTRLIVITIASVLFVRRYIFKKE